jgi:predicted GH43/DUF377 family glycosyl hydrolase
MKQKAVTADLFVRHPLNPIVTVADLAYQANAVFNPGAAMVNGETLLLARVEDRRGISHLAALRSKDGVTGWVSDPGPTYPPKPGEFPEETWGVEDPRLTYLEEAKLWGIVYTAYSRRGFQVSMATTRDFKTFKRHGSILPPADKNAALFPRKFRGQWAILHRPVAPGQDANIWISFSHGLHHWGEHQQVLECRRGVWWDSHRIGACPPPLETPEGWLVCYHGVHDAVNGAIYRLGLCLLDLEHPEKVIRRGEEWIFGPQAPYERAGDVPNVVFPCGWIYDKASGAIRMYYGAADTCIGLATASMSDVLDYILRSPES